MKPRRIYWRWKGGQYVLEGRLPSGKAKTLWTLPPPQKFISQLQSNASFFTKEKREQILKIYECLQVKAERRPKHLSKVPPSKITRTHKNDALTKMKGGNHII